MVLVNNTLLRPLRIPNKRAPEAEPSNWGGWNELIKTSHTGTVMAKRGRLKVSFHEYDPTFCLGIRGPVTGLLSSWKAIGRTGPNNYFTSPTPCEH